jgi:hypothetical protein
MQTSALPLYLARLRLSRFMTTIPLLWRMSAGWRIWRLSWLVAWLFWWQFVASLTWVQRTFVHCVLTNMSACNISFVDLLMFPFAGFLGDVRREFMQRLCIALHGTLGSFLRDALQEGSADVVACLRVPRAWACGVFSLVVSTARSCKIFFQY